MDQMKYSIKFSNTDVRKLHNLAKNSIFSYATVKKIMDNIDHENEKIYFFSKQSYDKYKENEFSTLAFYGKNGF